MGSYLAITRYKRECVVSTSAFAEELSVKETREQQKSCGVPLGIRRGGVDIVEGPV